MVDVEGQQGGEEINRFKPGIQGYEKEKNELIYQVLQGQGLIIK
jgi:hypothetical protein